MVQVCPFSSCPGSLTGIYISDIYKLDQVGPDSL